MRRGALIAMWSLAGCLSSSDPQILFFGLPEQEARSVILAIEPQSGAPRLLAYAYEDVALSIDEAEASGATFSAFMYPESLAELHFAPGPLEVVKEGPSRTLPEPSAMFSRGVDDAEWREATFDEPLSSLLLRVQCPKVESQTVWTSTTGTGYSQALLFSAGRVVIGVSNYTGEDSNQELTSSQVVMLHRDFTIDAAHSFVGFIQAGAVDANDNIVLSIEGTLSRVEPEPFAIRPMSSLPADAASRVLRIAAGDPGRTGHGFALTNNGRVFELDDSGATLLGELGFTDVVSSSGGITRDPDGRVFAARSDYLGILRSDGDRTVIEEPPIDGFGYSTIAYVEGFGVLAPEKAGGAIVRYTGTRWVVLDDAEPDTAAIAPYEDSFVFIAQSDTFGIYLPELASQCPLVDLGSFDSARVLLLNDGNHILAFGTRSRVPELILVDISLL